jgi:hypothetical protein
MLESFSRTQKSKPQLSFVKIGEGLSVNINNVNEAKADVSEALRGYSEADIYNTYESALFIHLIRARYCPISKQWRKVLSKARIGSPFF